MQIIQNLQQWRALRKDFSTASQIGFVPTMGNIHIGHLSLCRESLAANDMTIVSIFVNPTQFNQQNDLENYPRTLDDDLQKLRDIGVHYCFLPNENDIYPDKYRYRIEENQLSKQLEGVSRPGHFTGVLTVVMKLLNLVKPHNLYLGEKDYQQCELISGMIDSFYMDVTVHICPTIRESSGLAYSSRNSRLTPEQLTVANKFAQCFHQPAVDLEEIRQKLIHYGIDIDYLETRDQRRFVAVKIGDIRLIDNYAMQEG